MSFYNYLLILEKCLEKCLITQTQIHPIQISESRNGMRLKQVMVISLVVNDWLCKYLFHRPKCDFWWRHQEWKYLLHLSLIVYGIHSSLSKIYFMNMKLSKHFSHNILKTGSSYVFDSRMSQLYKNSNSIQCKAFSSHKMAEGFWKTLWNILKSEKKYGNFYLIRIH